MIAAHLDSDLEDRFRELCDRNGQTIKGRLTLMITRELDKEEVDEDVDSRRISA